MCTGVVCLGRKRCGFWYNLAPLVWTFISLILIYKKEKKIEQNNKQQKTCLWLLPSTSEQTFKELLGSRNWNCANYKIQNFWSQIFRKNMFMTLQENSGKAHFFAKGYFTMPLPWKSSAIPCHWWLAQFSGMTACLVPYVHNQASKLRSMHSNSIWLSQWEGLGSQEYVGMIAIWFWDKESVLCLDCPQQFTQWTNPPWWD